MWLRWCEFFGIFWLLPMALFIFREHLGAFAVPIIVLIALCCAQLLYRRGILQKHWQRMKKMQLADLNPLVKTFAATSSVLLLLTVVFLPDKLLTLPFEHTNKWLLLLLLYPILSVIPQEIVFRTFFFHRYKKIIQKKKHRALLGSVSFGIAHLIYGNWVAVVLSFIGSLLFSFRFIESKSTAVVVIEHSALGLFVFTIGLGHYFVAHHLI